MTPLHPLPRRLLLAAPALLAARAAPAQRPAPEPAETIRDPRIATFELGDPPWRIFLATPPGPPPAAGFPVLTLLDGNASFPLAWRALEARRQAGCGDGLVLLGVGYPGEERFDMRRRFLDLTPPTARENFGGREPPETGGQEAFASFLAGPLRAAVAARLPVDPARQMLFGHSLGGLFALHLFFTRPALFEGIVAADPSIWWNGRSILAEQAAFLAGAGAAGGRLATPRRLLIQTSGRNRPPPPDASPAMRARLEGPGGKETAEALATLGGLSVRHVHFAEDTHGTMLAPSIAQAVDMALGAC